MVDRIENKRDMSLLAYLYKRETGEDYQLLTLN